MCLRVTHHDEYIFQVPALRTATTITLALSLGQSLLIIFFLSDRIRISRSAFCTKTNQ